jgi:hypothetical protein
MKEKIYLVFAITACDCNIYTEQKAFRNKKDAENYFQEQWEEGFETFIESYEEGEYDVEEDKYYKEVFEEGYAVQNHFRVSIHEIELY